MESKTSHVDFSCGRLIATTCYDQDGKVCDYHLRLGPAGSCTALVLSVIGRLIRVCLEYDIPLDEVSDALEGGYCPGGAWHGGVKYESCVGFIKELIDKEITNARDIPVD